MIFWFIGWFFTLGFLKEDKCLILIFGALVFWPCILGDELREYLDKENKYERKYKRNNEAY